VLTARAGQPGQLMPAERARQGDAPGETDGIGRGAGEQNATDARIIEMSLNEPSCFGTIFDRHAGEILRYAHARLGPDLAEDVLAETFLAAFSRRANYDTSRADARPWLYGIAIRQIGRHRRAEVRGRRALARIPAEAVTGDFGERSADRVTAQQLRPRLAAVLSGLPRRDRELLLLIAWADLTYEESAQALGVPVSTVRSQLHRIRTKSRQALGGTNPTHVPQEETDHG
jgi:RNA polymerase sigma factor (sigma-70 family)